MCCEVKITVSAFSATFSLINSVSFSCMYAYMCTLCSVSAFERLLGTRLLFYAQVTKAAYVIKKGSQEILLAYI